MLERYKPSKYSLHPLEKAQPFTILFQPLFVFFLKSGEMENSLLKSCTNAQQHFPHQKCPQYESYKETNTA